MNIDAKQAVIDGRRYDVVSLEEYSSNPSLANNSTAVAVNAFGQSYILPYRAPTDTRPGIYDMGVIYEFNIPENIPDEYYYDNSCIDFGNSTTMGEIIEKQAQLRCHEADILTSPDNITMPVVSIEDTPAMQAIKEAVLAKHIDMDKYAARFGPNYPNEKRILKQHSITFGKLGRMMENLDIAGEIILYDKNPDVPNPMGKKIVVSLNGGGGQDE